MQSPQDDTSDETAAGRARAALRARGVPPGGKALLRLLDLLGGSGYEAAAQESLAAAVGAKAGAEFASQAAALAVLPRGLAPAKPKGAPRRGRAKQPPGTAEECARAHLAALAPPGAPASTGPQWRSLGPWTVPNGQTYGASRVNVSGRVAAIAVDPSNAAHLLVGTSRANHSRGSSSTTSPDTASGAPRTSPTQDRSAAS